MSDFEKLTGENIRAEAGRGMLIVPVGAIEQHGPHLPLTVDTEIPLHIASKLVKKVQGVVAPPIFYGARSLPQSGGGPSFPGTIHVGGSVFTEYLKDVIAGYISAGFRSILILNGHYENESFIFEALERSREEGRLDGIKIIALDWWSLVPQALLEQLFGDRFPGWHAEHAGVCETSLMLYFREDLVGPVRVDNPNPPRAGIYLFPVEPSKISNRGVLGNTSSASAEIGGTLCREICEQLEKLVREHMNQ